MNKISVLVVDDHFLVRQGLCTFLDLYDDVEVVGESANGAEAVELAQKLLPDVVLMDLVMPVMDGVEATRRIHSLNQSTQVLVLTSFTEDDKVFASIKAGAAGYLLKNISPAELIDAIRATHWGEARLDPLIARRLMENLVARDDDTSEPSVNELTGRELEVLRCIAQGLSNREIAQMLGISGMTVKTHISSILSKLHLADRTQAAIYALKKGLMPAGC